VPVPIVCRDLPLEDGFRGDLIVEGRVLLQLKSVERVTPAREKQVQTYLRLTGLKPRYLLNFGEAVLRDGITRCVNRLEEDDLQRGRDAEIQSFPSPQVGHSLLNKIRRKYPPVTAMLALSSGCASEVFEVTSFDDRSDSLAGAAGTGEPS
jgi:hypothetical protein